MLISWVHPDHLKTSAHLNTGKNTSKPEDTHKKWPVSHSNEVAGTDDRTDRKTQHKLGQTISTLIPQQQLSPGALVALKLEPVNMLCNRL